MKIEIIKDEGNIKEIIERLEELSNMHVVVGILSKAGGDMLLIANVHEFGADIPVTDKMRGFFRYKFGISLKPSTTSIKIPERSFIRSGLDNKGNKILADGEKLLEQVLDGNLSAKNYYELLGQVAAQSIQEFVRAGISPKNAGLTISQKGSSSPLIDTGQLLSSITYEVRR